ncbi:MAG: tetratricopeptide repeat protein [Myxococcaceae bacterium]|nr:tetratricopeptide repeat protein [Myxococcaceae bacterium]
MAKSLVEKYEQILAQDPASTVFVELAKALIERGDNARAIEVCQAGLQHHPRSVIGRVLWGKSLINLGRPAEAMEQFDRAIAIDRDNPHAYNLIGEVLLHKGLYRSALPLLKKAVALQPNDGRVRQWLEQTQAALAGGPAPVLVEPTRVDPPTEQHEIDPGLPPDRDATEVSRPAYVPANGAGGADAEAPTELNAIVALAPSVQQGTGPKPGIPVLTPVSQAARPTGTQPGIPVRTPAAQTARPSGLQPGIPVLTPVAQAAQPAATQPGIPVLTPAAAPAHPGSNGQTNGEIPNGSESEPDPFAAVPRRTDSAEVMVGLTATFNALAGTDEADANAKAPEDPFDVVARRSVAALRKANGLAEERGETLPIQVPQPSPTVPDEPSVAVSQDLFLDGKVEVHDPKDRPDAGGGLLGELPPPSEENPVPVSAAPAPAPAPAPAKKPAGTGLLEDIPELEPTSSLEVPKVEVSASAAEAIAREYERELREKLAASKAKRSFFARHWLKFATFGVAVVALAVGALIYVRTLSVNQGSLADALIEAKKAILQDTRASYDEALKALERARRMDEDVTEVWALEAYTRGILFAEHGAHPEDRQAGLAALNHRGVKEEFPGLYATAAWFLADGKDRAERGRQLIAANGPSAEENALAGRLLLDKGDPKGARERFEVALQGQPNNVRVLVAVGDFTRANGDCQKALEFYETAGKISPAHPARVLGAAECRLELGQDLDTSVTEMKTLPADDEISEDLRFRKAIVQGRLLAATGSTAQAIDVLTQAAKRFRSRGYEANLALGQAFRQAGRMVDAQDAFEAALAEKPHSEDALEALARVLVDRDRPKEALARVPANPESRRISLVRGVAWARSGDWKRARSELERTQVGGRFPSEAVIYLARADAQDGEVDRAIQVLEKILPVAKRARAEALVALGDIHYARGELDKAKARYEEAAKDPDDVEGACAYGRLLLELGFPKLAVDPLERAVRRNDSHNEAHAALARAYLMTGRVGEAVELISKWKDATDRVASSYRLSALALYQSGKLDEAEKEASLAIRYDKDAPESWRVRSAIHFAQGDSKAAFKDLERANKLDPKDPETFCAIGHAFLRTGNTAGAEAAFAAAVREDKDSVCGQIGAFYVKLPRVPRSALKTLTTLAREAPAVWDRAFAEATRARVLLASGRSKDAKEAKEAADEAIKLAPWFGPAQLAAALAAERLKLDDAEAAFARAVSVDPTNGAIRLEHAEFLAKGDDEDQAKALDEYERFLQIGGDEDAVSRAERAAAALKKRLASR